MAETDVIRTPDQRLRVFVSSTLQELAAERQAVRDAVTRLRLVPVMFELGARPHPPRQVYRSYLAQSQVFVGVYWQSYGWVAPGEQVSGLEDEYLLSAGLPRLIYVKSPAAERESRLAEMLTRIRDDGDVSYQHFSAAAELQRLVENDLAVLLSERFERAPPRDGAADGASLAGAVHDRQNARVGGVLPDCPRRDAWLPRSATPGPDGRPLPACPAAPPPPAGSRPSPPPTPRRPPGRRCAAAASPTPRPSGSARRSKSRPSRKRAICSSVTTFHLPSSGTVAVCALTVWLTATARG